MGEGCERVEGFKVEVWTGYDEEDARVRAEGRNEKGKEREKKERVLVGDREKRIFIRVEILKMSCCS